MTVRGLEAGIVAADGAALAAFYVAGLGFTLDRVLQFPQGHVRRLSNGQARIKIFQPAEAPGPARDVAWSAAAGFAYAALHVDDAAGTVAAAVSAGASVLTAVTNHRPGAWFALIADPVGNVWEILQEEAP